MPYLKRSGLETMTSYLSRFPASSPPFGNGRHTNSGVFDNKFFSSSWPYSYISPLQAYILGVFTCMAVFIAYNFLVAHSSTATPPRRRRGSNRMKSPWKRKNRNVQTSPMISTNKPWSTRRTSKDNLFVGAPARMPEEPRSNDKIYRRLTSKIQETAATRVLRKKNRMANKRTGSINSYTSRRQYEDSTELLCHVVGHHPIARNRARYNRNQTAKYCETTRPAVVKSSSTSSYNDTNVWQFSVPNTPASHELFNFMNAQPLQRDVESNIANGVVEVEEKPVATSSAVPECIENKSDSMHASKPFSKPSMANKENVDMQLTGDGNRKDSESRIKGSNSSEKTAPTTSTTKLGSCSASKTISRAEDIGLTEFKRENGEVNVKDSNMNSDGYTGSQTPMSNSSKKKVATTYQQKGADGLSRESMAMTVDNAVPMEVDHLSKTCHPVKPAAAATKSHLTVLISNGVYDYTQSANQKAALLLLDDLSISYDVVDGMDPSQLKRRDAFFKISGIRGNYPQIFSSMDGEHKYLGGYEWLHTTNIEHLLQAAIGICKEQAEDSISVGKNEDATPSANATKARLTILISNGVYDYQQKANQKAALSLLDDLGISYDVVDGMDPLQKNKRDAFFKISGIRGNYPQIFFSANGDNNHTHLGGYEWLNSREFESLSRQNYVGKS